MNFLKKWENFLICLFVSVGILYLRLISEYPPEIIALTSNAIKFVERVVIVFDISELWNYIKTLSSGVLLLLWGSLYTTVGIILLFIFRRSMEQGSMILLKKPLEVIKSGTGIYFFCVILVFVYTYSVVGIPFSVGLGILTQIIIFIGNVPVSIFIGYTITEMLKIKGNTVICYFIGSFMMILCESIYAFGGAFTFFIFPVLSIGTVFMMFVNLVLYKVRYKIIFNTDDYEEIFDREKIRDIITKGIDDENNNNIIDSE